MKSRLLVTILLIITLAFSVSAMTPERGPRKLVVAAAQTPNLDNQYERSKDNAMRLIVEAAQKSAKLILLPEFGLIGYQFDDKIWEMAEPLNGPTVEWLRNLCKEYGVYIATSILEIRGDDFFNTLVLVGPGDNELWSHSKIEPALFEARYFREGGVNQSVFDTPLGRIGVSICADNEKTYTPKNLLKGEPEILLMAFSAPETPIVTKNIKNAIVEDYEKLPVLYAQILGVPIIQCNKTGKWNSPIPGFPGLRGKADFMARSKIVDADGKLLADLHKQEAVIVAEVEIGGTIKRRPELIPERRWFKQTGLVTWFSEYAFKSSKRRYERSSKRKMAVKTAKRRYPDNFR